MKPLFILSITLTIAFEGFCQENEESKSDSTLAEQTYSVVPFQERQTIKESSTAIYQMADPSALQFSYGQSVLTSLTGQVPNISINQSGYSTRLGTPLLVVDGMGYSSTWSNNANFNTFDFEKISVFNSGNLSPLIGGAAAQGAFVLQSKTGKNITKPTFTFNESINYSWFKSDDFLGTEFSREWWTFTSSIAYSQDFGKVDTRVSYNWANAPDDGLGSNAHAFRINTGFDITPKLSGRLIVDNNFYSRKEQAFRPFRIPDPNDINKSNNNAFNGNLFLNYSILDWLSISSQLGVSDLDLNSESTLIQQKENNNRQFGNLYLNARKKFNGFDTRFFIGGRVEKFKTYREATTSGGFNYATTEIEQALISTGINLNYNNFWTTDFTIGWEKSSLFPDDQKAFTNFSIGSSLVVTELLENKSTHLSFGKIRLNYNQAVPMIGFPYQRDENAIGPLPDDGLNKSFELGFDVNGLNSRIELSYTYFITIKDDLLLFSIPGTSGYYTQYNYFNYKLKGSEIAIWAKIVNQTKANFKTGFIWSNRDSKLESDQLSSSNGALGSFEPDWTTYWTNHFVWNTFTLRTIMGWNYGGKEYLFGNPPRVIDKTNFSIPELSLGYSFRNVLQGKFIEDINLSIVGRNLFQDYYKTDFEVRENFLEPRKNVSFNLGVIF